MTQQHADDSTWQAKMSMQGTRGLRHVLGVLEDFTSGICSLQCSLQQCWG